MQQDEDQRIDTPEEDPLLEEDLIQGKLRSKHTAEPQHLTLRNLHRRKPGRASSSVLGKLIPPAPIAEPGRSFDSFKISPQHNVENRFAVECLRFGNYLEDRFFADIFGSPKARNHDTFYALPFQYDHLFYAEACFYSTQRRLIGSKVAQPDLQEQHMYMHGLRLLQEALSKSDLRLHESTLRAIFRFSFSMQLPAAYGGTDRYPKQSSFKTWQMLDLVSGINIVEEHHKGLVTAIQLAGGPLGYTKQMQSGLQFYNIVRATRTLSHPIWPFMPFTPVRFDGEHLLGVPATSKPQDFGLNRGFDSLEFPSFTDQFGLEQPKATFRFIADITDILSIFASSGAWCNPKMLIVDQMNFVQYCLLALPAKAEISDPSSYTRNQLCIYECARLGAMGYAHLITYPVAAGSFPRELLMSKLKQELTIVTTQNSDINKNEWRLLLWAAVIGAVIVTGSDASRQAMIVVVRTLALKAGITTWKDAKSMMQAFLWHDETNDTDALDLWLEVQNVKR